RPFEEGCGATGRESDSDRCHKRPKRWPTFPAMRPGRPCGRHRRATSHWSFQGSANGKRARDYGGKVLGCLARCARGRNSRRWIAHAGFWVLKCSSAAGPIVAAVNGALESLGRSLALELAPVRVNVVSPGIIDTPIRAAMPEAARSEMLAKAAAALPVGRVGLGEDIARQILTFMTVGFATGSIVYLDGGGLIV